MTPYEQGFMDKMAEVGPVLAVKRAGMLESLARPVRRVWQEMKWHKILSEGHMPQIHNMDELDRLTAMILRTKPPPPPRRLPQAHVLDDIYEFLGKPNPLPRR